MCVRVRVTDDIAKSMSAKKRKLEQVTTSSVSSGSRKFDEVWKAQQNQRLVQQKSGCILIWLFLC